MNKDLAESLPECSKRRYAATTVAPNHFASSGLQLRQTILQRNIDRLVAVKVDEEIGSDELADKLAKVTKDVRDLLRHSDDTDAWQYWVIGLFCQYSSKKVESKLARGGSILYKLGSLAEFPVEVNHPHDGNTHPMFGLNQPTSVHFPVGKSSSAQDHQFVTAHLHEYTTTLAPLPGNRCVEQSPIPLQTLLCIGSINQDEWIKAIWESLRATRCYLYEDEPDTGGNNFRLIYKELAWKDG